MAKVSKSHKPPYVPTAQDKIANKKSWLVDTAETAKDKKALPTQLKAAGKSVAQAKVPTKKPAPKGKK